MTVDLTVRRRLMFSACSFAVALTAVTLATAPTAEAAKSCGKIVNPYPGTEYEGVDLSRIRAEHVSCRKARRVARGAHRKSLGQPLPPDGIRRLSWKGWRVRGDLRPDSDRYAARKGSKLVRWRFS